MVRRTFSRRAVVRLATRNDRIKLYFTLIMATRYVYRFVNKLKQKRAMTRATSTMRKWVQRKIFTSQHIAAHILINRFIQKFIFSTHLAENVMMILSRDISYRLSLYSKIDKNVRGTRAPFVLQNMHAIHINTLAHLPSQMRRLKQTYTDCKLLDLPKLFNSDRIYKKILNDQKIAMCKYIEYLVKALELRILYWKNAMITMAHYCHTNLKIPNDDEKLLENVTIYYITQVVHPMDVADRCYQDWVGDIQLQGCFDIGLGCPPNTPFSVLYSQLHLMPPSSIYDTQEKGGQLIFWLKT